MALSSFIQRSSGPVISQQASLPADPNGIKYVILQVLWFYWVLGVDKIVFWLRPSYRNSLLVNLTPKKVLGVTGLPVPFVDKEPVPSHTTLRSFDLEPRVITNYVVITFLKVRLTHSYYP